MRAARLLWMQTGFYRSDRRLPVAAQPVTGGAELAGLFGTPGDQPCAGPWKAS